MKASSRSALIVSVAVLLVASVYVNFFLNKGEARVTREPLSTIPKSFQGWESTDQAFPTKVLENLRVDEYLMRRFIKGQEVIWLYIGYYSAQKEGAVPHSPRHCYPGSGFQPIRNTVIEIPVLHDNSSFIRPNLYIFARGSEREVVIYWYQSRGRVIADEYREKIYLIMDSIFRNRSDGALVRFSLPTDAMNEEKSIRTLTSFIMEIYPEIPKVVPD